MQTHAKSFAIQHGTCHVYADRIEIRRQDIWGKLMSFLFARGLKRMFVLYGGLAVLFGLGIWGGWLLQNYFLSWFFSIASFFCLLLAWQQRKQSFAPVIFREQIDAIIYSPVVEGKSRAHFDIQFHLGNQHLLRTLPIPSRTHRGTSLADTAYWMLKDEGLISND